MQSPFWRAYFHLDAWAGIRVGGKTLRLEAGELLWIPEGLRYDCLPRKGVRHVWVHFRLEGESLPPLDASPRRGIPGGALGALWRELWEAADADKGLGALCASWPGEWSAVPLSSRLRELILWMDLRLATPPGVPEMARRAGMSTRSFHRWFRESTGRSPADYAMERRLREACRRLYLTEESLEQIAEATGFANRHHFSRVFRERSGRSPAACRREVT